MSRGSTADIDLGFEEQEIQKSGNHEIGKSEKKEFKTLSVITDIRKIASLKRIVADRGGTLEHVFDEVLAKGLKAMGPSYAVEAKPRPKDLKQK